MTRTWRGWALLALSGLFLVGVNAATAEAQRNLYRRPNPRASQNILSNPTVSPYLNLLQSRGAGLPNYQALVRPLVDQRQTANRQQREIRGLQSQVGHQGALLSRDSELRPTGHETHFMNHSRFYPNMGR